MCCVSYLGLGLCFVSRVDPAACFVMHRCAQGVLFYFQHNEDIKAKIWNCSRYQALGWFVICYIAYSANKVSCCGMERNTPVWFT